MAVLLSAKGSDILSWQGTRELLDWVRAAIRDAMSSVLPEERDGALHELTERLGAELAFDASFSARFTTLLAELEQAEDESRLGRLHGELNALAGEYFRRRGSVAALHSICVCYRERVAQKAIAIAGMEMGAPSPFPYAWLTMGSFGRGEHTLAPRLESLLVHLDAARESERWFEEFWNRGVSILARVGFAVRHEALPPMSFPLSGSRDEWRRRLKTPGDDILHLSELRPLSGDAPLAAELVRMACGAIQRNRELLRDAGRKVATMPVAVGFLGRFRLEREGVHRGLCDTGLYAWLPLVMNIRMLAIRNGIWETGSLARLARLLEEGEISVDLAERLIRAYHDFARLNIQQEADGGEGGLLDPEALSPEDGHALKDGIDALVSLQKLVYHTFSQEG